MRRMLFASDFSAASRKAFAVAVKMAKVNRGTLTIVHVFAPFVPVAGDQYVGPETWEQIDVQARLWARRQLVALIAKAKKAGVRAVGLTVDGTGERDWRSSFSAASPAAWHQSVPRTPR